MKNNGAVKLNSSVEEVTYSILATLTCYVTRKRSML